MIGLLFLITSAIQKMVADIKYTIDDEKCRSENVLKDGLTYIDNKGAKRLLSNGRRCMYDTINDQRVLIDFDSGKVIRNFTMEQAKITFSINKDIALKNGRRIFCIDEKNEHVNDSTVYIVNGKYVHHDKILGCRYLDLDTGNIYVLRKFNRRVYYYDYKNKNVIGISYAQKEEDQMWISHGKKPINIEFDNRVNDYIKSKKHDHIFNYDWNAMIDFVENDYLKKEKEEHNER